MWLSSLTKVSPLGVSFESEIHPLVPALCLLVHHDTQAAVSQTPIAVAKAVLVAKTSHHDESFPLNCGPKTSLCSLKNLLPEISSQRQIK